jgi:hypothetical protein
MTVPQAAASPSRTPTQEVLTEFILSLVQAFLRTGYYLPEHPQSKKAKVGLYNRFKSLFSGRHELTFMVQEIGETKNILVDGPLPDTQRLSSLMMKSMAEIYIPRLAKFLERKDLVSLTLKETMAEEEFSRFIDVMSEPTLVTLDREGKGRFVADLKENGILHISFVFNEDLVAPERKLPWRAQLAISRLKKDLKLIPLFQHLDTDGFRSVRRQILHDVLRPITKPELMASILLNSDLARTPEATEQEIEDELVNYIPEKFLVETGREALRTHLGSEGGRPPEERKRALLKLFPRLHSEDISSSAGAAELIREFFAEGLVDFRDLPEALQKQITIERETNRYLAERVRMLQLFEASPSKQLYKARTESLLRTLEELIHRNLLDEVLVLVTTFRGHASLGGFRAPIAAEALEEVGRGKMAAALKENFLHGNKEVRLTLAPIFQALGEPAEEPLLEVVKQTRSGWVRKNACETLLRMGPGAVERLLRALKSGELPAIAVAEILMVFGEFPRPSPELLQALREHVKHPDRRVREEAAWALCRLRGAEEEGLFLDLLDDPELEVTKRAVRCLGTVRSQKGLTRLVEILRRSREDPGLAPLEIQVYHTLAEFPDASIEPGVTTEQFLVGLLKENYPRGLRALFHRGRHGLVTEAFWAVCETLGTIGAQPTLEVLTEISKHAGEPARGRLRQTIERIEARLGREAKAAS